MIDQELKIKIVDYADGVLDESLKAEVEEILQSNGEANEFLNQLKSVEIELNSKFFFATSTRRWCRNPSTIYIAFKF